MLQPLNLKNEITKIEHKWPIKNVEKYFMTHQYMSKIFHGPHKNPPAPPPTYLMYGPLTSKFNKGFRFLLYVIDIFSKHAWVFSLKYKKT